MPTRLVKCELRAYYDAERPTTAVAAAFALQPNREDAIVELIGCSLDAVGGHERETQVYDIGKEDLTLAPATVRVFESKFSRWNVPIHTLGPIEHASQLILAFSPESATSLLNGKTLLSSEQVVVPTAQPDAFRVLSATGSVASMGQTVFLIGRDFADNPITDAIVLSGTSTVSGIKPFAIVDKIILPASTGPGQTVSVGTTSEFGLFYPLGSTTDLLQLSVLPSGQSAFQVQTGTGTPDVGRATVVPPATVSTGDRLEYRIRTSR